MWSSNHQKPTVHFTFWKISFKNNIHYPYTIKFCERISNSFIFFKHAVKELLPFLWVGWVHILLQAFLWSSPNQQCAHMAWRKILRRKMHFIIIIIIIICCFFSLSIMVAKNSQLVIKKKLEKLYCWQSSLRRLICGLNGLIPQIWYAVCCYFTFLIPTKCNMIKLTSAHFSYVCPPGKTFYEIAHCSLNWRFVKANRK